MVVHCLLLKNLKDISKTVIKPLKPEEINFCDPKLCEFYAEHKPRMHIACNKSDVCPLL